MVINIPVTVNYDVTPCKSPDQNTSPRACKYQSRANGQCYLKTSDKKRIPGPPKNTKTNYSKTDYVWI